MNLVNTIAAAAVTMMHDVKPMRSTLPPTPWRDCLGTPVRARGNYIHAGGGLKRIDMRGFDRTMRRAGTQTARQQRNRIKMLRRKHAKPAGTPALQ